MDKTPVAPPSPVPTTGTKASMSPGLHPRERLDVCGKPCCNGAGEGGRGAQGRLGILTMTGMVEALHRICFTRRYRSYRGFMTCLSFLVTCKHMYIFIYPVSLVSVLAWPRNHTSVQCAEVKQELKGRNQAERDHRTIQVATGIKTEGRKPVSSLSLTEPVSAPLKLITLGTLLFTHDLQSGSH